MNVGDRVKSVYEHFTLPDGSVRNGAVIAKMNDGEADMIRVEFDGSYFIETGKPFTFWYMADDFQPE